jgi:hypothetical protein
VAAVSDPRPPNSSSVGYYEIEPWGDGEDADHRFREACANAELIVTAVNERDSLLERVRVLEDEVGYWRAQAEEYAGQALPDADLL